MALPRLIRILCIAIFLLLLSFYIFAKWQSYSQDGINTKYGTFQHYILDYAVKYGIPKNSVSFSRTKNDELQVDIIYKGDNHNEIFTDVEIEKLNHNAESSQTSDKINKLFLHYKPDKI